MVTVHNRDVITLSDLGTTVRLVARGGTSETRRGQAGTWDFLDTRHRPRLRLHLTYAGGFADNLLADPTLLTTYGWSGFDVDIIIQDAASQESLFDETVDKFNELGMPCNLGMLPVAPVVVDPGDLTLGINSVWCNRFYWEPKAEQLSTYLELGGERLSLWLHCQMEAAPPPVSQAIKSNVEAAGKTFADVYEGMKPYTDVVRAARRRVIVRPFASEDWGLMQVMDAGEEGSIYCVENDGFSGKLYRESQDNWRGTIGLYREVWARARSFAPRHCEPNQFHYESGLRMYGSGIRADYLKESDRYPIYEITYLNERNGPSPNAPEIGKTAWFQCTTLQHNIIGLGATEYPSVNDADDVWTIPEEEVDGLTVSTAYMCGKDHGLVTASSLDPWQRQVGPDIDAVHNSMTLDTLGRGWITAKDETHANQANCWRVSPECLNGSGSFTLRFIANLTALPGVGATWGICGQAQSNAHGWNLLAINGSGIVANTRAAVGQDTTVINASPTTGEQVFLIEFDISGGGIGTWKFNGVSHTSTLIKNSANASLLIGGTHDLLNRTTVVWGYAGLVLPYGSQVAFWRRPITANERTCLLDIGNILPVGYGLL